MIFTKRLNKVIFSTFALVLLVPASIFEAETIGEKENINKRLDELRTEYEELNDYYYNSTECSTETKPSECYGALGRMKWINNEAKKLNEQLFEVDQKLEEEKRQETREIELQEKEIANDNTINNNSIEAEKALQDRQEAKTYKMIFVISGIILVIGLLFIVSLNLVIKRNKGRKLE